DERRLDGHRCPPGQPAGPMGRHTDLVDATGREVTSARPPGRTSGLLLAGIIRQPWRGQVRRTGKRWPVFPIELSVNRSPCDAVTAVSGALGSIRRRSSFG